MELTELDHKIIALMKENARRSHREMGRILKESYSLVGERLKLLEDNNILTVVAVNDLRNSGFEHMLHLEIQVQGRSVDAVANDLAALNEVVAVSIISGQFEIVALLLALDKEDLERRLEKDIGGISGIRRLVATLALDIMKYEFDVVPLK